MRYSPENWALKRAKGLGRFLMFDGILLTGGPFAVVMQFVGYFILADESQTFLKYFSTSTMWTTFFLHATLFGTIIGYLNWRRNEKSHSSNKVEVEN